MKILIENDAKFGNHSVEVSRNEKRHIRATHKTYESTGDYIFLKLFKKNQLGNFETRQVIGLTLAEFDLQIQKAHEIKDNRKKPSNQPKV